MLDLISVRLFVLTTELGSLTRAAEAAGTVQPAVSQRIRQLEQVLGHRLLERTPRFVRVTDRGATFLDKARALLAAHDEAAAFAQEPPFRFALGVSDHAVGNALEPILRQMRAALPLGAAIEVRHAMSPLLRAQFEDGSLDAIVIRRECGSPEGEVLGADPLGWRSMLAAADIRDVVPLVTLGDPCGVRASALRGLDEARQSWREVFTGGSCHSVIAAVRAGLGVAPMGAIASGGLADMGPRLGLPPLPASEVAMFARASNENANGAIRAISACLRQALGGR
jgi:DNA-binding transcriptional LysR family regulator